MEEKKLWVAAKVDERKSRKEWIKVVMAEVVIGDDSSDETEVIVKGFCRWRRRYD